MIDTGVVGWITLCLLFKRLRKIHDCCIPLVAKTCVILKSVKSMLELLCFRLALFVGHCTLNALEVKISAVSFCRGSWFCSVLFHDFSHYMSQCFGHVDGCFTSTNVNRMWANWLLLKITLYFFAFWLFEIVTWDSIFFLFLSSFCLLLYWILPPGVKWSNVRFAWHELY